MTLRENIVAAATKVENNIQGLMGLAIAVILFLFAGVVASGQLIQARILASIVLSFVNNLLCGFGLLMLAVAIYLFVKNGAALAGAYDLMGYLLGMAILFIVVAVAGHCAVRHKSFPLLMVYLFFSLALLGACMGGVWLAFNNSTAVKTWIENADDNTISAVANSLYLSSNKAGIISGVQANMQKIGLAFGVLLILQALSLVCAAVFGWAANNWRIEYGVRMQCPPSTFLIPPLFFHSCSSYLVSPPLPNPLRAAQGRTRSAAQGHAGRHHPLCAPKGKRRKRARRRAAQCARKPSLPAAEKRGRCCLKEKPHVVYCLITFF